MLQTDQFVYDNKRRANIAAPVLGGHPVKVYMNTKKETGVESDLDVEELAEYTIEIQGTSVSDWSIDTFELD